MNAKELMIGDWVRQKFSGLHLRVHSITPPYILAYGEEGRFYEDSVEPIPITPEILEKNGFMEYRYRQGDWFFVIENKENETLAIVSYYPSHKLEIESWDDLIGSFERGGIKYIHQLQQAMRLCEINKEIIVEDKE